MAYRGEGHSALRSPLRQNCGTQCESQPSIWAPWKVRHPPLVNFQYTPSTIQSCQILAHVIEGFLQKSGSIWTASTPHSTGWVLAEKCVASDFFLIYFKMLLALKTPKDGGPKADKSGPILQSRPKAKTKRAPPPKEKETQKKVSDQPDKKTNQSCKTDTPCYTWALCILCFFLNLQRECPLSFFCCFFERPRCRNFKCRNIHLTLRATGGGRDFVPLNLKKSEVLKSGLQTGD